MSKLLTSKQAAVYLAERGVRVTSKRGKDLAPSVIAVQRWCQQGLLSGAYREENRWRIPQEALDTFEPPTMGRPPQES